MEYAVGDRVKVDTREFKGELNVTFFLEPCTPADDGEFTVIAKNTAGEAKTTAKLTVSCKYCL